MGKRIKRQEKKKIPDMPTASRAKKRHIQLSPSTGVIQATEPSDIPVLTEIEFVNFTDDVETDPLALGDDSGSNMEEKEENNSLRTLLNLENALVEDLVELNPTEAMELKSLDADEGQVFRDIAADDVDVSHFDWCSGYKNFEGVREEFTRPSGPTFDHLEMSPLGVFEKIWDTSLIDHIVRESNNNARELQSKTAGKLESRISRWKETTREEIWRFLFILMLQSIVVNSQDREYWYPSNEHLRIGNFENLMTYNRFVLIKKCLHFTDNSSLPEQPSKVDMIRPIIAHFNKKFGTLYLPEQNVTIDESLFLWKERLSFSKKIAKRKVWEGIKSCEICESRTGYLWKIEVCSGKGHVHAPQEVGAVKGQKAKVELDNAKSLIVLNLMRPLLGKGHTLVMDNNYNSPILSRLLKAKHQTDTIGTLRLDRKFAPATLKVKTKDNMKYGETCFSSTKDLCVVVYMDKSIVPMISTFHQPEERVTPKDGFMRLRNRPEVIQDFNLSMDGIDRKNQTLNCYPIEKSSIQCWYKNLFRRLLNVSMHNASVIHDHGRRGSENVGHRYFRLQLVKEMLEKHCKPFPTLQPPKPKLSEMHLPVKVKSQRCKLCYRNKVQRSTVWSCGMCKIYLCIRGCYAEYHKVLSEQDFL